MEEQQVAGNENIPAQARGVWASPGVHREPERGLKSAGTAQKEGDPPQKKSRCFPFIAMTPIPAPPGRAVTGQRSRGTERLWSPKPACQQQLSFPVGSVKGVLLPLCLLCRETEDGQETVL